MTQIINSTNNLLHNTMFLVMTSLVIHKDFLKSFTFLCNVFCLYFFIVGHWCMRHYSLYFQTRFCWGFSLSGWWFGVEEVINNIKAIIKRIIITTWLLVFTEVFLNYFSFFNFFPCVLIAILRYPSEEAFQYSRFSWSVLSFG